MGIQLWQKCGRLNMMLKSPERYSVVKMQLMQERCRLNSIAHNHIMGYTETMCLETSMLPSIEVAGNLQWRHTRVTTYSARSAGSIFLQKTNVKILMACIMLVSRNVSVLMVNVPTAETELLFLF